MNLSHMLKLNTAILITFSLAYTSTAFAGGKEEIMESDLPSMVSASGSI